VNPIRRSALIAVVSGVAVASLALPSAVNAAPTTPSPAAAAAGYLARQMSAHSNHLVDVFGGKTYADDGETADAVLSMDAAGAAQHEATLATKWLEKDAKNYLGGTVPDIYPGSAAKLLLVAEAQHVDPTNFGGINLVDDIDQTSGGGGAPAGEFQNASDTKFSASVLVQSLALLALADSASTDSPSSDAVAFLRGQQCANGGFQVAIRTDPMPACATSGEDIDTTAYAVQALLAVGQHGSAEIAAMWLAGARRPDGGWSEAPGGKSDANSTALAVEALIDAHRGAAGSGLKWLLSHQQGCSAAKGSRGAVRYQGKYEAATAIRATSQAGAALAARALPWIDASGASASAPSLKC
jgi:hypothetical protein